MKTVFAILAACTLSMSAHAGCYSVYNRSGNLIHQSSQAPVDTRQEYHRTVPQRFGPGSTLVYINDAQPCADLVTRAGLPGASDSRATGMAARTQGRPARADRG